MNRIRKTILALVLAAAVLLSCAPAASADSALKVGAARADITGPITDISTGYNSLGDLMEGLLTRLYARAFVVDDGTEPMVIVSAELVHMTESIKPGVLKKLRADGYSVFSEENVMLTATHCHASTSNTAWVPLYDLVNGTPGYDDESYAVIVRGVARAIEQAYDARVPGSVSLVYGETEIPTSNRSADAFLQNHTASALGYDVAADGSFSYETGLRAAQSAVNHEMAGIVLTDAQGRDLGFLNFYGSHGTSNPITNRLVASDHKGYAALEMEREMGGGFVAAFAQADSGDASPNAVDPADYHKAFLRPTDLDPALDAIENQIVHGRQEADAAMRLLRSAERIPLTGSFGLNYTVLDFSRITVDLRYVGDDHMPYDDLSAGAVKTCEPCIGAGIIAGDEEGAPVDNAAEGAVRHQFVYNAKTGGYDRIPCDFKMIDLYGLQYLFEPFWPLAMKILQSDEYDEQQMEKVVCLAVGNLMQKAQPLQILRFGPLAVAGVPFELTFEQANRTRAVLERTLAPAGVRKVILATHANAYSQYVTTREEFAAQHYEGATCLFGPWSGAALTQELDKLAQGIAGGYHAHKSAGLMQSVPSNLLYTSAALAQDGADAAGYGKLTADVEKSDYAPGERVTAAFSAVTPRHVSFAMIADDPLAEDWPYLLVQRQENGAWVTAFTDTDPYTTFRCVRAGTGYEATVGWLLKSDLLRTGTYRLVYQGLAKRADGKFERFSAASSPFRVNVPGDDGTTPTPTPTPVPTATPAPVPTATPAPVNPFRDVPDDAYFRDAVLWAVSHEPPITQGVSADRFAPDETCTRAQFVTFLWRAAGEPEPAGKTSPFTDVQPGGYYEKAVRWAAERGVTVGVSETRFAPDDTVTRGQVVTFLWRFEGRPAPQSDAVSFSDVPADSPYRTAILWAAEQGIARGYDAATFGTNDGCTRAQTVTFLYRALAQ